MSFVIRDVQSNHNIVFVVYIRSIKAGESNGKLTPRTCPGCSVPKPYRSHDWGLIPANPACKAEY